MNSRTGCRPRVHRGGHHRADHLVAQFRRLRVLRSRRRRPRAFPADAAQQRGDGGCRARDFAHRGLHEAVVGLDVSVGARCIRTQERSPARARARQERIRARGPTSSIESLRHARGRFAGRPPPSRRPQSGKASAGSRTGPRYCLAGGLLRAHAQARSQRQPAVRLSWRRDRQPAMSMYGYIVPGVAAAARITIAIVLGTGRPSAAHAGVPPSGASSAWPPPTRGSVAG